MSGDTWPNYLALRRHLRELRAANPGLTTLGRPRADRRLLAVWDFRQCPSNLGDILVLHQRMQLLRHETGLDQVDYAFVGERGRILSHNEHYRAGVNDESWQAPLPGLLRTVNLSAHAGSTFFFDGYDAFDDFVEANLDRYHIWPSGRLHDVPQSAFGRNFDAVQEFCVAHGWYPALEIRPQWLRYAARFFLDQVAPALPVVCHVRNNVLRPDNRNAPIEAWVEFFSRSADAHDAKFILIGAVGEIDDRFRDLPNVLIAKDFGTSLEEDLALAHCPYLFLGTSSGPACMAIFSDTPYVVFHFQPEWEMIARDHDFAFATPHQRLTWERETADTIQDAFTDLWSRLDPVPWWAKMTRWAAAGDAARTDLVWDRG